MHKHTGIHSYTRTWTTLPPLGLACKQTYIHTLPHATTAVQWAAGTTRWGTDAPPLIWPVATVTQWGPTNGCSLWRGVGDGFGWHPKLSRWYGPPTFNHIPAKLWQLEAVIDLLHVSVGAWFHPELGSTHTISINKSGSIQINRDITKKTRKWLFSKFRKFFVSPLFQMVCFPHRETVFTWFTGHKTRTKILCCNVLRELN